MTTNPATPFAPSCLWKRPIPATAQLQAATDPETATFRAACTFWGGDSLRLQQAAPADPLATWHYRSRADTSGFWPFDNPHNWADSSVRLQTPANLAAAFAGGDRNVGLITADGRTYIEGWQYSFDAVTGEHSVEVMTAHDLAGPGWPSLIGRTDRQCMSTGIRAAGGPLLAGLLRGPEIAALNIEHAIAIILPQDKLKSPALPAVSQLPAGSVPVVTGGKGYAVGDVLAIVALAARPAEITVTRVDAVGAVLAVWVTNPGTYDFQFSAATADTFPIVASSSTASRAKTEARHGRGCQLSIAANLPYDQENARVWPATNVDANATTAYTGNVPMGSLWTIPPAVDVAALGLATPEAVAWALAIQRYGAYVVDATVPGTQLMALTASDVTDAQFQAIRGALPGDPGWHMPAFRIVAQQMVMVRNNVPPLAELFPPVKPARRGT